MIPWGFVLGTAVAAESILVDIPFTPPEDVPLFLKAEISRTRGSVPGDDCSGAVQTALDEAEQHGRVVRVTVSDTDLSPAVQASCVQRWAGKNISASVVVLHSLVIVPGAPESVYPIMTPDRVTQITALLAALGGGDPSTLPIDDIRGKAWIRFGHEVLPRKLDASIFDVHTRGVEAYTELVKDWVPKWVTVVQGIPEIHGAILEVEVMTRMPDRRRVSRELFRFAVPTSAAAAYMRGELEDDTFPAAEVERAASVKLRDFQPLSASDEDVADPVAPGRPELEVDVDDLEDVETDASSSSPTEDPFDTQDDIADQ